MAQKTPEEVVLDSVFDEFCRTEYPGEDVSFAFEVFSASQVLKPRDITGDELSAGIVDGDGDGGIDSFYVFLNGTVLNVDDPLFDAGSESRRRIGQHPLLEVFLIQSKMSKNWAESTWEHLLSSLPILLDMSGEDVEMEQQFAAAVVERTGIFRRAINVLAAKFPKIEFNVCYVARAPEQNVSDTILMRSRQVESVIKARLTAESRVTATHVGVQELYALADRDYSRPGKLVFDSDPIRRDKSYLGLVSLRDYLSFVRTETGQLRDELFDSNVRDFEGDNLVNEAIAATLAKDDETKFWWLNNGITILGTDVDAPQKILTIQQPLIVNGLQTTRVIDKAERSGRLSDGRLPEQIVVRVIESDDQETRDRIIAGTNRQTSVPTAALYATQEMQRKIERFFRVHNWYYERRKNYYKNQGVPAARRITINFLAQVMTTLMLGEPENARARPTTVFNRSGGYESIFPDDLSEEAYLRAVEVTKAIEVYLSTEAAKRILDEKVNIRFHVAAGYCILALDIKNIKHIGPNVFRHNYHRLTTPLNQAHAEKALSVLNLCARHYQGKYPDKSRDTIFKSADFRNMYFGSLM
jgi:hypothetical protein